MAIIPIYDPSGSVVGNTTGITTTGTAIPYAPLCTYYFTCPNCGSQCPGDRPHDCPGPRAAIRDTTLLQAEVVLQGNRIYDTLWQRCDDIDRKIDTLTQVLSELLKAINEVKCR